MFLWFLCDIVCFFFFFFNDTATTEIYTLSLHDALPICLGGEDGRRFERIRGDKAHPASQGYTCQKALRLDHDQNGRHRLTSPLRRRPDGTYEEIDWDTAIAEVAASLQGVIDRHGGESILYYGAGGQGNHLGGSYGLSFYAGLGSKFRSL